MEGVKGSCSRTTMLLLGLMLVVAVCELRMASAADLSPSQCKEERQLGINACKAVVFGQPASPACCQRIRVSHFECACPAFDAKLAALIDVKKATKLLTDCGRKVPRHFKCGSLYFP